MVEVLERPLPEKLWEKYSKELGREQREALALFYLSKKGVLANPKEIKKAHISIHPEKGLIIRLKGKTYHYSPKEIYRDLEAYLKEQYPQTSLGEKEYKTLLKTFSVMPATTQHIEYGIGSLIPVVAEEAPTPGGNITLEYRKREGIKEKRYGVSGRLGGERKVSLTYGEEGVSTTYHIDLSGGENYLTLNAPMGNVGLLYVLRNPYLKPRYIFNLSTLKKTSLVLKPYVDLGPWMVTWNAGRVVMKFSPYSFGMLFFQWAWMPYFSEELRRRVGTFNITSLSSWGGALQAVGVATVRSIYNITGLEYAVHRVRKIKEKGLWGFVKKAACFVGCWAYGLLKEVWDFSTHIIRTTILSVVDTFYLLQNILNVPARPFKAEGKEDFLLRMEEIRQEMEMGMYAKAAMDIKGMMKSPTVPPYLEGQLEAWYEYASLKSQGSGLMGIINLATFNFFKGFTHRAIRKNEERVREIGERLEKGERVKEEEVMWALGYISAKLNGVGRPAKPKPGYMSTLTPLESLTGEEAYYYLYRLSHYAYNNISEREYPLFYATAVQNIYGILQCCAPLSLRPYGAYALQLLSQKNVEDPTFDILLKRLEGPPIRSVLFPKDGALLVNHLLSFVGGWALRGELRKEEKRVEVLKEVLDGERLTKAIEQLHSTYGNLFSRWERGDITTDELASSLSALLPVHLGLLAILSTTSREGVSNGVLQELEEDGKKVLGLLLGLGTFPTGHTSLFRIFLTHHRAVFGYHENVSKEYASKALVALLTAEVGEDPSQAYRHVEELLKAKEYKEYCPVCVELLREVKESLRKDPSGGEALKLLSQWYYRVGF